MSSATGWCSEFVLEAEVQVTTWVGFVALPCIAVCPGVWNSHLSSDGYSENSNSLVIKTPLLLFWQFCAFCRCTSDGEGSTPFQALHYWAPRSPVEADRTVPGSLAQPQSLILRLQSRIFIQLREQKCPLHF